MGFWIFMFIMVILTPIIMIIFGVYSYNNAPKKINNFVGYRTTMSMKNKDTWEFAHHYCGKIWRTLGLIMLIVSAVAMFFSIGKDIDFISIFGCIILGIQVITMIASIFPVESALKRTFDENGNRKD
ncbi:MAG: hypothetical protein DBX47_01025 [Clostridiales bacterium]|nr:MAG: hypothetical protein DBX47_01025 [Clostridiales bacterium]